MAESARAEQSIEMTDARLLRCGLWLEYGTLGWNVVGALVVLAAAVSARSVALAGFGLDSLIEIVASTVVVWQLKGRPRTASSGLSGLSASRSHCPRSTSPHSRSPRSRAAHRP